MKGPHSSPRNWSPSTARDPDCLFPSLWALDAGGSPLSLYWVPIRLPRRPFGRLPLDAPHGSQVKPPPQLPLFLCSTEGILLSFKVCHTYWFPVSCSMTISATKTRDRLAFGHSCIPRAWSSENALWSVLWTFVESMDGACFLITINLLDGQAYLREPLDQS